MEDDELREETATAPPAVTIAAAGIIDGDPDVLAALCARRGPAVLDYCRHVSASGLSTQACADAFARFRVVVAEVADPEAIDPDRTLLRLTRHAAAEHAMQLGLARPGPLGRGSRCLETAHALADREGGTLPGVARRRLAAHLRGCADCREAEARALAAEQAYRGPSMQTLPAATASAVLTALAQALTAAEPNAPQEYVVAASALEVAPPVASVITHAAIRDGDPAALAALCERRGPAVLEYCSQVAGPDDAVPAAADALADFRASVGAAGELTAASAEALLRSMTRRAAVAWCVDAIARDGSQADACGGREFELVAFVEDGLSPAELEDLEEHVPGCNTCAGMLARMQTAEHALDERPREALPAGVPEQLLGALVAAAPVSFHGGDGAAVRDEALRRLEIDGMPDTPSGQPASADGAPSPSDGDRGGSRRRRRVLAAVLAISGAAGVVVVLVVLTLAS